jgi:hypothetical protein
LQRRVCPEETAFLPEREGGGDGMKKAYECPELKVFGTVTELTLNACNYPDADGKSCNNLGGL